MLKSTFDGAIVSVIKPPGISSFGVVRKIRHASGVQRVGHAGTLDPFAEGVLVVGIGRSATRRLGAICDRDKEYAADVRLGRATDTGDPTGKVISEQPVPALSHDIIASALNNFRGEIEQIPPRYSAVKVNGQRLYKLARRGVDVVRSPRRVTIYEIQLIDFSDSGFQMQVVCSKGTYIRVLAEDIGKALGTVAHLSRLVRTRVGEFLLSESEDLENLTAKLQAERLSE